jgi:hypothetical protein
MSDRLHEPFDSLHDPMGSPTRTHGNSVSPTAFSSDLSETMGDLSEDLQGNVTSLNLSIPTAPPPSPERLGELINEINDQVVEDATVSGKGYSFFRHPLD